MIGYIILGIVTLILLFSIVINNQIIAKKNRIDQAYSSIDVYLKKRFDLVPNLIAIVNKYVKHEKEILLGVTELRTKISEATQQNEKIEASNKLTSLMANINVENYPEIKANQQFLELQFTILKIEEQLSASRRAYNAGVVDYNDKIQMFPAIIVAKFRNDKIAETLKTSVQEQKNININQLLN